MWRVGRASLCRRLSTLAASGDLALRIATSTTPGCTGLRLSAGVAAGDPKPDAVVLPVRRSLIKDGATGSTLLGHVSGGRLEAITNTPADDLLRSVAVASIKDKPRPLFASSTCVIVQPIDDKGSDRPSTLRKALHQSLKAAASVRCKV